MLKMKTKSSHYDYHLGNFEIADRALIEAAIKKSGFNILIKPGRYDKNRVIWSEDGISLWCDLLQSDLSSFWALLPQEVTG